jgi:hypothetical protein
LSAFSSFIRQLTLDLPHQLDDLVGRAVAGLGLHLTEFAAQLFDRLAGLRRELGQVVGSEEVGEVEENHGSSVLILESIAYKVWVIASCRSAMRR